MIAIAFDPGYRGDLIEVFDTSAAAFRYRGDFNVFKEAVWAGANKLVGAIKPARRRILEEKAWGEGEELVLWEIIPVIDALFQLVVPS
jgi:hypothetical protein